jgi:hypothetical protein
VTSLELYDREGSIVQIVAATQDDCDPMTWNLADPAAFGDRRVASALLRFANGTSVAVPAPSSASKGLVTAVSVSVPTEPDPADPGAPVNSL